MKGSCASSPKNISIGLLVIIYCWMLVTFAIGCSSIKETVRGIAGVSTKILEDKRPDAISNTFRMEYDVCYDKVNKALKTQGSYIYAEDKQKNMLAIYVSKEDTTPVGIFFQEVDKVNTRVEVSSPSTWAKEYISKNIFSALEK